MTNKLWFLTKNSLKKKMGSKWFLAANILLFVVIAGLLNIDNIISSFGGDFEEKTEILVINHTNQEFYSMFETEYNRNKQMLEAMSSSELVSYDKSEEEARKEVSEEGKLLLILNTSETNYIEMKLISKSEMDALILQNITLSLNNAKAGYALSLSKIDPEELNAIYAPVKIEKEYLEDTKNIDESMNLVMGTVFPILVLPFFMLTMFLVQMIGAEVNEEKTTRGMEIIISNVSPKTHFYSKILAGNIFVLSQGILLISFVVIGFLIRFFVTKSMLPVDVTGEFSGVVTGLIAQLGETGIFDTLAYVIPLTLILMVINFVLYSLLAGILASMTTNMEDFQQLQTPLILISLVGYYLSVMSAMFDGSLFIRIVSYIPFISPLVSPALLVTGQIGIFDIFISIAVSLGFVFLLTKYGLRIYKVGILNYSSTKLWRKMFRAMRNEKV